MIAAYSERRLRELREQGSVTALAFNDPEQLKTLTTESAPEAEDVGEQWWTPNGPQIGERVTSTN